MISRVYLAFRQHCGPIWNKCVFLQRQTFFGKIVSFLEWPLMNIILYFSSFYKIEEAKWFVFLDEKSNVNLEILTEVFSRFGNSDYGIFLGHVVTHSDGIRYPDPLAGVNFINVFRTHFSYEFLAPSQT